LNTAAHNEWIDAQRSADFERAWQISDRSLSEYCESGTVKHAGERHLQRIWRGEHLNNNRVLVRCYHGLGDTIQFIRFAKALRRVARDVIVWAQPELSALLRHVEGVDQVFPLHEGTPDFEYDVDIEVMELAHALRVSREIISSTVPYFRLEEAPPTPARSSFRSIGLVWEVGNWDRRRCVEPQMFAALHAVSGVRLFSLQQGPGRGMAATIPAEDIAAPDLETLAATIMKLDLIVTVDTMVAHLAGALGRPVWTLLHADCDWRWPKTSPRTIWYPTMKLFNQKTAGDWTGVVKDVANQLRRCPQNVCDQASIG
jgi:hypothetical protein